MTTLRAIPGLKPGPPRDLTAEISRVHALWNARLWDAKLTVPEVLRATLAPNARRPVVYEWLRTDPPRSRILVSDRRAAAAGASETLHALLRAMVWQFVHEHGDPPARPDHHTREWIDEARRVGLEVSGRDGVTSPTAARLDEIEAFALHLDLGPPPKPARVTSRKWMCRCSPGYSVYVARADFSATCSVCKHKFHLSGKP